MQYNLFNDTLQMKSILSSLVNAEEIVETHKWQEFHANGQLWIDGEIAVIKPEYKDKYDYRDGWFDSREHKEGCGAYFIPKSTPVCRIGVWTRYYDNGQIDWKLDYGDGLFDKKDSKVTRNKFPSFYKDGTVKRY